MATTTTVTLTYHQQIIKNKDEQHQKEIRALESKIERFRQAADDRRKALFDELHRGERLAKSLGFTDIHDAQCAIDTVDSELSFVECYNQLHQLELQVDTAEKDEEIWRMKCSQLEQENATLNAQIKELRLLTDKLSSELKDLQMRNDELSSAKKRAAERYKADYAIWKTYRFWCSKLEDTQTEVNLTQDRKKSDIENMARKIPIYEKETGIKLPVEMEEPLPALGGIEVKKDDDVTPTKKRTIAEISGEAQVQQPVVLKPIDNNIPAASVPRKPPTRTHKPISPIEDVQVKEEPASSPLSLRGSQSDHNRVAGSSDTEDDSQAITISRPGFPNMTFQVPAPLPQTRKPLPIQNAAHSSDIDEDSQEFPTSSPSLPPRPKQHHPRPVRREPSTIASPMRHLRPHTDRPAKFRRLSVEGSPHRLARLPISTPRNVSGLSKLHLIRTEGPPASMKGKEREPDSTPLARTAGHTNTNDYSAFKGRGRYGKTANAPVADRKSINALFEINPTANAGKNFQFEEVVRNKEQRKKLHAGDCECCRDYYETVGPLPERPKQPLWRSPSNTPQKPCRAKDHSRLADCGPSTSGRSGIDKVSHQKQVSRHRYAWERAKTPPGFWDIGFPNTQEVNDINEQADNIHQQKRDAIEREAASGSGRYRRK